MKKIAEGSDRICRLLGKQSVRDREYRLLKYLLCAECEGGLLLKNMITGQVVLLDPEEESHLSSLPAKPDDVLKPLIEDFFLVSVDYDEKETVLVLRRLMERLFPAAGINGYMILPSTNCNAGCAYCFEQNISGSSMSPETAKRAADYIAQKKGPGPVSIHWFGGEPLLGIGQIDVICSRLKERNIEFSSKMTSNGYLFDERTVENAVREWNLRQVQITLDGTEENYNAIKSYRGVSGSPYQKVLHNVSLLLENGVDVRLRLSLTSGNGEDLGRLIGELEDRFGDYGKHIKDSNKLLKDAGRLYPYIAFVSQEMNETCGWECISPEHVLEFQALTDRIEKIWPSKASLNGLETTKCMADDDGSVVIMPDGSLQKCENIADGNTFGSIYSEDQDKSKRLKYKEKIEFDRCRDCPLYPVCILLKECIPARRINETYCKYLVELSKKKLCALCVDIFT